MEAVLTRLKGLSAAELSEEFVRADLKCGPITSTTRATYERKLARVLAGQEGAAAAETDSSCSSQITDGAASFSKPAAGDTSAVSLESAAAGSSSSTSQRNGEDLDFGYGVGLNPPDEEEISGKSDFNSSADCSSSQFKAETPSKPAQASPTFYYGVCPLWEDVLARTEGTHVYTDKKDALQAVKSMKGARFKAFTCREDAERFSKGLCDYCPSPSKSTPCISPIKPGLVVGKEHVEVDTINREKANSFKSPRSQDLTAKLRKAVEKGDEQAFSELVWNNPRYLIGSGDNPTVVQEGCRYNVMHVAAKENQAGIAQLLLDTLENPEFMHLMYPDDQEVMLQKRIRYIVDLYLNTPDKASFETPLHFACKFGCPDVVNVLCSHPDIDKNCKNRDGQKPSDLICSRKNKTAEVKQRISDYLEDRCYIPLLRATDNTSQPIIGASWSPESSESLSLIQRHTRSPTDPWMTVTAFAGPLSPSKADDFRRSWKTPPRERAEFFHHILKSDPDRGAERVGRDLAHELGHPWAEYWGFLECFVDLSSAEGLRKLEEYLSKKDFNHRAHEGAGPNETSNRFKTPSPGKPKKFCNSISVGAFLDEGDDISLEEIKNRQNAALSSITSSAASKDTLKGAVGGREFHIALRHRGADLIENAAEQDLLCCCDDGLLSPGVVCKTGACSSLSSSRDRTHNGEKASPRGSPSSSCMLSPISNLMAEFERMSLHEPADSPAGYRERRSGSRNRHKDGRNSCSSFSATDLSSGLNRLSLRQDGRDRAESGGSSSSGSSDEYFTAEESLESLGRTRGSASGVRNFCARSKSWDHGGRDLSSSSSSGSSYKSLDNSHEFLPRTPPHFRRGLFIEGDSPTKLDSEVMSALRDADIDPQKYPSVHKWKSTMKSYSSSDMQSWPSPVVKPRLRMQQQQTPGSPGSGLMSPTGRFSPVRHAASPDFSPSRYSPANVSYIQRLRFKHLSEPLF
ncbi:ankyrin repeat and LEM domain-containing protein 2 isoform X1 [Poecilia reticulata]|uniref:Ankyrin repeat and LEM domain-containing protein 2 n=1 Tax=Poecilia reticulata TaxID=8081 RepID=A0A3P9Q2R7_POERE|nr:PREDICTED: ankyrin repeat and LEM domain-containing protein 2 isoform X1 [Poecilia reticulata]XP_008415843.1 PREDICTED: ankyrin repeat and LEM domain-containing protein 2 isoform X1 [Poecilia reticulata]XP_008415844.1 PREDICTED: ankyrin repeat and LEM domain-containing protein 2 isoform X1 [Poecilia reticulata]